MAIKISNTTVIDDSRKLVNIAEATTNTLQIGQSGTNTNNFVISVPTTPDGTLKLSRGNNGGTVSDIISVDASNNVSLGTGGQLLSASNTVAVSNKTISYANNTLTGVQPTLVSGINIKSVNGSSILGSGDLNIQAGVTKYIGGNTTISSSLSALFDSLNTYSIPDLTTLASNYAILFPNGVTPPTQFNLEGGWKLNLLSAAANQVLSPYPAACKHGIWSAAEYIPPAVNSWNTLSTIYSTVSLTPSLHVINQLAGTGYLRVWDSSSNTWGSTSQAGTGKPLYRTSDTSFFMSDTSAATKYSVTPATVSGTTITLGTSTEVTSLGTDGNLIQVEQLSDSTFVVLYSKGTAPSLSVYAKAFTVVGLTVTAGTEVAIGTYTASTQSSASSSVACSLIDSTKILVAYLANGGGTTNTRAVSARVLSVSGTTITLGTASTAGNISNSAIWKIVKFSSTQFATVSSATTGTNWYGISISGSTATLGTLNAQTGITISSESVTYMLSGTTAIFSVGTNKFAITISGNTLSIGTPTIVGTTSSNTLYTDAKTGTLIYAYDTTQKVLSRLSVSGLVVSVVDNISAHASVPWIYSDTVTNASVKIGGVSYTRNIPALQISGFRKLGTDYIITQRDTNNYVYIYSLSSFDIY